ncbi:MAG: hypothetical protein CMB42_04455 [Euryarchaeota archaeon]|nr:hypothetical protein [Euryarchaeota archaeon]|tara:strand:+ start:105314 stop:105544 length:231 start_codon:yes stop_codon:yes gene_type:complete
MGTTQAHVNIENNFQFLLFIRLWKSKGKFALSNIEEFVKLTENRMIDIPKIPGRDLKDEILQMKEYLSLLIDRFSE